MKFEAYRACGTDPAACSLVYRIFSGGREPGGLATSNRWNNQRRCQSHLSAKIIKSPQSSCLAFGATRLPSRFGTT